MMILLIAAMNVIVVNKASAQQTLGDKLKGMTPSRRAEYQTGLMKTKLHLDTQQIVKVKVVNLNMPKRWSRSLKVVIAALPNIGNLKSCRRQKMPN